MYEDKELVCKDCGKTFVFTAGEQEFYAEKGFQNEPQRCKNAETLRKTQAKALVNFSPLLALLAVLKLKFPSSPEKTDLFTAANAMLK